MEVPGETLGLDRRLEQPDQAVSCVWNPQKEKKDWKVCGEDMQAGASAGGRKRPASHLVGRI